MTRTEIIKNHCKQLNLTALSIDCESIISEAEKNKLTYQEFFNDILDI